LHFIYLTLNLKEGGQDNTGGEDKLLEWTEEDKESKRLEKEVMLPNILITLAIFHQGTDFFEQHNILTSVLTTAHIIALADTHFFLHVSGLRST